MYDVAGSVVYGNVVERIQMMRKSRIDSYVRDR